MERLRKGRGVLTVGKMEIERPSMGAEFEPWTVSSVARIRDKEQQIAEIERRLSERSEYLRTQGVAMTPIEAQVDLGLDDATWARWKTGRMERKQTSGISAEITPEDVEVSIREGCLLGRPLTEKDKEDLKRDLEIVKRRRETIKKFLLAGESTCVFDVQSKPNGQNGGSLEVMKRIYKYGDKTNQEEQVLASLDDLLGAARDLMQKLPGE